MLKIDPTAKISKFADIEQSIRGSDIIIRENVTIDSFVKIKPAGGEGNIIIGKNSYINSGCVLYIGNGINIGEGVLIASNCTLAPTNHEYKRKDRTIIEQRFKQSKGGIIIEDDVWIGANVVVLDGAIIRKGCVIGAGSIVIGELISYGVYVGNPLKLIKLRE